MKHMPGFEHVSQRVSDALHLDWIRRAWREFESDLSSGEFEWVLAYRTASGFCCLHRGVAIDFPELQDVQVWADEREIQVYFMGL